MLWPHQNKLADDIFESLAKPNVDATLAVLPTGGGKTVVFSHVIDTYADLLKHVIDRAGPACAVAHREELVRQMSTTLAKQGVEHRIIAPPKVVKKCVKAHVKKVGRSFYNPNSTKAVAGVDTLVMRNGTGKDGDMFYHRLPGRILEYGPRVEGRWGAPRAYGDEHVPIEWNSGKTAPKDRDFRIKPWLDSVRLWIIDEAHHVLLDNKWGTACAMFPNAKGLGVTATPLRADGCGLGSAYQGVFDEMVEGPSMRWLIDNGFLTDYRVVAPRTEDLDLSDVPVGKTGDLSLPKMRKAVSKSKIVGDVVKHYLKFARGKRGVTFAASLEDARGIAKAFNAAGIPAAIVHGESSDEDRASASEKLESGELLQLVNVDLFGEGYDLPAIEVVSMARPTQSFGLFVQQFGRALRLLLPDALMAKWGQLTSEERLWHIANSAKPVALIIDHVGNVGTPKNPNHGLPDGARVWSLASREKRGRSQVVVSAVTTCLNPECLEVYERFRPECPYCDHKVEPSSDSRGSPEKVDGDLTELTPHALAQLRGAVEEVDKPIAEYAEDLFNRRVPQIGILAQCKRRTQQQEAQEKLRETMAWWAGHQKSQGYSLQECYRKFFLGFGLDVLSAQTLNANDATVLEDKLKNAIDGIVNTG